LENMNRSAELPPSAGGRYTGFGNTVDPPPKPQSNEILDTALSSLTQGWSLFSSAAGKIASTATENAVKFGGIASQKAVELSGTVSEKVSEIREKGLKDGLSSMVHSFSSPGIAGGNYASSYGGPIHERIPESDPIERRNLFGSDPSERSSLTSGSYNKGNSNNVSSGGDQNQAWDDWGEEDWGNQGTGGYQDSYAKPKAKTSSSDGSKRTSRKSDDWSWDNDDNNWGGKNK